MPTPTRLTDIRAFLHRWGDAAPWTPQRGTLDAVLATLSHRRDDAEFWSELAGLTARLDDHHFRPRPVTGSDVLDDDAADALVRALRQALPERDDAARSSSWTHNASPQALVAFALLAMATACSGDRDSAGDTNTAPEDCAEAVAENISEDESATYCALVDLIEDSDLSSADKAEILACLPEYGASEREQLLTEWASATEAELLVLLTDVADDCGNNATSGTH